MVTQGKFHLAIRVRTNHSASNYTRTFMSWSQMFDFMPKLVDDTLRLYPEASILFTIQVGAEECRKQELSPDEKEI